MKTLDNKSKEFLKYEGRNILYDDDFLKFVDYIKLTKWYTNVYTYCQKNNKDVDDMFESFCIIRKINVGYRTMFVPSVITKCDIEKNTKKWKIYKKIITSKIETPDERLV
jgi:hypothetical protein